MELQGPMGYIVSMNIKAQRFQNLRIIRIYEGPAQGEEEEVIYDGRTGYHPPILGGTEEIRRAHALERAFRRPEGTDEDLCPICGAPFENPGL